MLNAFQLDNILLFYFHVVKLIEKLKKQVCCKLTTMVDLLRVLKEYSKKTCQKKFTLALWFCNAKFCVLPTFHMACLIKTLSHPGREKMLKVATIIPF